MELSCCRSVRKACEIQNDLRHCGSWGERSQTVERKLSSHAYEPEGHYVVPIEIIRKVEMAQGLGCITVMADFTWVGYVIVDLLRERPLLRALERPWLGIWKPG